MRFRIASLAALSLLAISAARADHPPAAPADAPAAAAPAAAPAAPAPAAAPADKAAPADAAAPAAAAAPAKGGDRAYVDTAVEFLKAYAHSSRKGDQGSAAWDTLKQIGGDKIAVTIAGAHHDLDTAAKTGDARLVQFQKISTWREGNDIKGVQVDVLDFKVGADEHKGKGKVAMANAGGTWSVTSVDVE